MSSEAMCLTQRNPTFFIKFNPSVHKTIGCPRATLILSSLEYWFSKYERGFYKFLEPCKHPLYKNGDSWCEEVGVSRKIFNRAFDLIGVRYKSKTDFKRLSDPFDGKLYASYHCRKTNKTHFVRNHHFASQFLKGIFEGRGERWKNRGEGEGGATNKTTRTTSLQPKKQNQTHSDRGTQEKMPSLTNDLSAHATQYNTPMGHCGPTPGHCNLTLGDFSPTHKQTHPTQSKGVVLTQSSAPQIQDSLHQKGRSWNGLFGRSSYILIQRDTSSFKEGCVASGVQGEAVSVDCDTAEMTEGMIHCWKNKVGDLGVATLNPVIKQRLYRTLQTSFGSCLVAWNDYCRLIASSKFLMGEAKNKFFKKAWISWAIKEEVINLIQGGHYQCGDRDVPKDESQQRVEEDLQEVRVEIEGLKHHKLRIKDEVVHRRRHIVRESFNELCGSEKEKAQKIFEKWLIIQSSPTAKDFKEQGWRMPFAQTLFQGYWMDRADNDLFETTIDEETNTLLKKRGMAQKLEELEGLEKNLCGTLRKDEGAVIVV